MNAMPKIVEPADLRKAYLFLSETYGKDIYRESIKASGFFLDITGEAMPYGYSWVEKEQRIFKKLMDLGVPSQLLDNSSRKKECEQIIKKTKTDLEADFDPEDIEVSLEHLCAALEIQVKIRASYEKGGEIPETPMTGHTIEEAIQKMNHIRWFLNHESGYQWNGSKNGLEELRKLFNNPKANKVMIEQKYGQVVSEFQNNPFEKLIVLNNHKKNFESDFFENYFIAVKGTWVPVGFAKQFPCQECDDGFLEWDLTKKNFLNKIRSLRSNSNAQSKSADPLKSLISQGRRFCIWSILFLAVFVFFSMVNYELLRLPYLYELLKFHSYNPIKMYQSILTGMNYGKEYMIYSLVTVVSYLAAILLLLQIILTFFRTRKVSKKLAPVSKQMNAFGEKIPQKVEELYNNMYKYWTGKASRVTIHANDYQALVNSVGNTARGKNVIPVKKMGKFLRFCMFLACIFAIFLTRGENFRNTAVYGNTLQAFAASQANLSIEQSDSEGNAISQLVDEVVSNGIGKVTQALVLSTAEEVAGTPEVSIIGTDQSSCVKSKAEYMAASVIDNNDATSWQEGVDGPGINECIRLDFDGTYEIQYLALKLGNWKSAEGYQNNNRPKVIEFQMGSERVSYEFEDKQEEVLLRFVIPVQSVNIQLNLLDVYTGVKYDDTCISEVKVYGTKIEEQAEASEADAVLAEAVPEEDVTAAETAAETAETQQEEKQEKTWEGSVTFEQQNGLLADGDRIDLDSVRSQLSATQAERSVYVLDVTRMQDYEIENPDSSLPASALVAVPVLFTVANDAGDGTHLMADLVTVRTDSGGRGYLSRDYQAGALVDLKTMITYALKYSDNNAINSLIDFLGCEHINDVCRRAGYNSVDVQTRIGEYDGGKNNYISTRDTALMLNAIYQNNYPEINRDFLTENFRIDPSDTSNVGMYSTGQTCSDFMNFNGVQTDKYNETGIFVKDGEVFIISVMTQNGVMENCAAMVRDVTGTLVSAL